MALDTAATIRCDIDSICASVKVVAANDSVPVPAVALSVTTSGNKTPAVAVASAGPWMCATVAGPDSVAYVPESVKTLVFTSKVAVTDPVPVLTTGGTWFVPASEVL